MSTALSNLRSAAPAAERPRGLAAGGAKAMVNPQGVPPPQGSCYSYWETGKCSFGGSPYCKYQHITPGEAMKTSKGQAKGGYSADYQDKGYGKGRQK